MGGDGVAVEGLDSAGDTKGQPDQADDADKDEYPFGDLVDRGVYSLQQTHGS